eukprot:1477515-Rhodomonas_salina.4
MRRPRAALGEVEVRLGPLTECRRSGPAQALGELEIKCKRAHWPSALYQTFSAVRLISRAVSRSSSREIKRKTAHAPYTCVAGMCFVCV